MRAAIERRLRALEHKTQGGNRPSAAFVLWERTRELVEGALQRALAAGAVKRGDPIIIGVMPEPASLPEPRWTDVAQLSDSELDALAGEKADEVTSADYAGVRSMSDDDLNAAIVSSLPRAL